MKSSYSVQLSRSSCVWFLFRCLLWPGRSNKCSLRTFFRPYVQWSSLYLEFRKVSSSVKCCCAFAHAYRVVCHFDHYSKHRGCLYKLAANTNICLNHNLCLGSSFRNIGWTKEEVGKTFKFTAFLLHNYLKLLQISGLGSGQVWVGMRNTASLQCLHFPYKHRIQWPICWILLRKVGTRVIYNFAY